MMNSIDSIILIVLSILLVGFFAGSETALVACSKVKLRNKAKRRSWRARYLERLVGSPEGFFSLVLVGTNLAVVVCTATATALAVRLAGNSGAVAATFIMTPLLLVFGEVIPKSAYLYHADRISLLVAPLLRLMEYILWPLVLPTTYLARMLTRFTSSGERSHSILSTREELIYLYSRGRVGGTAEERERRMIDRVFQFGVVRVGDLMIPMEDVVSFPVTASVDEVIAEANKHTFSRFPLISPHDGRVVGIISLFDLLGLDGGERLATVMHPAFFAGIDEYAERLLVRMKDDPNHFAVVVDGGRAVGIVTLENILENIIGDITNEY